MKKDILAYTPKQNIEEILLSSARNTDTLIDNKLIEN